MLNDHPTFCLSIVILLTEVYGKSGDTYNCSGRLGSFLMCLPLLSNSRMKSVKAHISLTTLPLKSTSISINFYLLEKNLPFSSISMPGCLVILYMLWMRKKKREMNIGVLIKWVKMAGRLDVHMLYRKTLLMLRLEKREKYLSRHAMTTF